SLNKEIRQAVERNTSSLYEKNFEGLLFAIRKDYEIPEGIRVSRAVDKLNEFHFQNLTFEELWNLKKLIKEYQKAVGMSFSDELVANIIIKALPKDMAYMLVGRGIKMNSGTILLE